MSFLRKVALVAAFGGCLSTELIGEETGVFRYRADHPDAPAIRFRPVQQGLPDGLSPQELIAKVDPQQQSSWIFGWFVYGESNSRSVGVGMPKGSRTQLYIDSNRDKQFDASERFTQEADSGLWSVPLGAEFITELNDFIQVDRWVWLRPARRGGFLEIATRGAMEGTVDAGETRMAALRIDRDSNGRWFDAADRILLDLSGDGEVDRIGGRVACDSICQLVGKRFVMQSDQTGERLRLIELSGTGYVHPQIHFDTAGVKVSDVQGALVSQSGVYVALRSVDEPIECPVGHYRVESLTIEVEHEEAKYWFRFSGLDLSSHPIVVAAGKTQNVDLLGEITLTHRLASVSLPRGTQLIITPQLKTSRGLYLSGGRVGQSRPNLENRLLTKSMVGDQVFDQNSTGFS